MSVSSLIFFSQAYAADQQKQAGLSVPTNSAWAGQRQVGRFFAQYLVSAAGHAASTVGRFAQNTTVSVNRKSAGDASDPMHESLHRGLGMGPF